MITFYQRLLACVLSLLATLTVHASFTDLPIDRLLDELVFQSPEQLITTLSTIPTNIQNKLKESLINKHKEFFIKLLTVPQTLTGNNDIVNATVYKLTGYRDIFELESNISPDKKFTIKYSDNKPLRLYNANIQQFYNLEGHNTDHWGPVVAFSSDSKFALIGSDNNVLRLWNLTTLEYHVLIGHTERVMSIAFSPNGQYALTGSLDCTARLWDLTTFQSKELRGHTKEVNSVAFSPDGKQALIASFDKTASIWDISTLQSQVLIGHKKAIFSAVFSHDGKSVLTGSADCTSRLWDLHTLQSQIITSDGVYYVKLVAFSSDNKLALSRLGHHAVSLCPILHLEELDLEQLLFMLKLNQSTANLNNNYYKGIIESFAPCIDKLPKLPIKNYPGNPLVKAYIDLKRSQLLLQAVADDDITTVTQLLKKGFCLNTCDKAGNNLWHYAFRGTNGHASKKVLKLLVNLEGTTKGFKNLNQAGLPPVAIGVIYNRNFTTKFIDRYCKHIPTQNYCTIQ